MDTLMSLQSGIISMVANPEMLICLILGVFGGLVFGAIPGLTAALGVTLMLPFTYAMPAGQGLATLIGIFVGGISGGLVSAVLLNIPGTPSSIVTTFDGAPMAKNGKPAEALSLGVFSSLIGGLFAGLILILIAPLLAKVAVIFGAWEYFALGIMGLCVVVALCSQDMIKGLMSAIVGLLIAMVGYDTVSGVPRFTFGFWQLGGGLGTMAVLMGLFAFAEILSQVKGLDVKTEKLQVQKMKLLPSRDLLKGTGRVFTIGSLIGTLIGILPGIGQTTASLISYNVSRQTSKSPEKYGTGFAEGIIASETANNAVCGGALIPMMTMGIPGDLVTAVLLGGLIIHGLQPGPGLFTYNADIVNLIYVAYLLSNIIMFFMLMVMMKVFIKVLSVPSNYLYAVILLMCLVDAYTVNNRLFDCWVLVIVGIVGYILLRSGFTLTPIILGYILGPIIETNFRTAVISNRGDVMSIFGSPIAVVLILFGIAMAALPSILNRKAGKQQQAIAAVCDSD